MRHWYKYFLLRTSNIVISNVTLTVFNQICFKPLFHVIRSSTKIIEFDHEKFPADISSEDVVCREFLEIDNNSMFSKRNQGFKNVRFLTLSFIQQVIIRWLLDNDFTFKDLLNFLFSGPQKNNLWFLSKSIGDHGWLTTKSFKVTLPKTP